MRGFLAAAAACPMLCPLDARAQTVDARLEPDLRCLLLAITLIHSDDQARKDAGHLTMLYFLGRLDAAAPDLDLENSIRDVMREANKRPLVNDAQRCGDTLGARAVALVEIGENLRRRAAEPATDEP